MSNSNLSGVLILVTMSWCGHCHKLIDKDPQNPTSPSMWEKIMDYPILRKKVAFKHYKSEQSHGSPVVKNDAPVFIKEKIRGFPTFAFIPMNVYNKFFVFNSGTSPDSVRENAPIRIEESEIFFYSGIRTPESISKWIEEKFDSMSKIKSAQVLPSPSMASKLPTSRPQQKAEIKSLVKETVYMPANSIEGGVKSGNIIFVPRRF